jgi:micrococcal nuclease
MDAEAALRADCAVARALEHVGERWTLVNLELVRQGYAQVETDPPDVRYADRFVAAQRAAREAGLGLWGTAAPDGS